MHDIPRSEYPRPQFQRKAYLNLNGAWQFEIDHGASGRKRGLLHKEKLDGTIIVPFCPESSLSGVQYTDFMAAVWYKRTFTLPEEANGKRVFLHFGAVDYRCEAWVNGQSVGVHEGGFASFTFEITAALQMGENTLVVCAEDDTRSGLQPLGKQSMRYESYGCHYTRTTGIWQTVWLEWTEETFLRHVKMIPDAQNGCVYLDAVIDGNAHGCMLKAEASFAGENEGCAQTLADGGHAKLMLAVRDRHLWTAGKGNLYDLKLTLLKNGEAIDQVDSYFALRTISFEGKKCLINGKSVFQRLVLDQGFYPDGIWTAPSDEALRGDIEKSMAMGFNGARLHQKVFEQRFLYWADRLGYLCWGEMGNWGVEPSNPPIMNIFLREWLEVVARDFNSPCIVGWCPYNEVWKESNFGLREMALAMTYRVTKAMDETRPVIDVSGGFHAETDIYDTHDYEQDPAVFAERYQKGAPLYDRFEGKQHYDGVKPMLVSEYGGIRWTNDESGWGYGKGPESEEEFIHRYRGLTTALLNNPEHMGFCYTQLTDVEQEQNGLYTYDRKAKFDPDVIRQINRQKAAIEEE
ncbi:MAG: beta galactosidase jelly roll domain-containing protein [Clostridia bacterium]|nr:beta galactosidase jelly roll domain-containing protein [Clostridia bacterium]